MYPILFEFRANSHLVDKQRTKNRQLITVTPFTAITNRPLLCLSIAVKKSRLSIAGPSLTSIKTIDFQEIAF